MNVPLVAIIGLPNVGKSTFFNKVLEQRKALTHPEAGTTRDRAFGLTSWNGLDFYLIDTAGIVSKTYTDLEKNIQKQTQIAIEEADLIVVMVDGKQDVGHQDHALAQDLIRSKKPVLLAANKIDVRNPKIEAIVATYQKLGLGQPYLLSSVNGSGVGDLLDGIVEKLSKTFSKESVDYSDRTKIVFLGKPNVGKSSLINAILKQERLLVDEKAGTTRSTVEIPFEFMDEKFLLLDTAGIKKKWKEDTAVDVVAAMHALKSLSTTDIVLFVLDATEPPTVQDQAIATEIVESHKSVILVLNKADRIDETQKDKLLNMLPDYFSKLWWSSVIFTSAVTGEGLEMMLKLCSKIYRESFKELSIEELDAFLDEMVEKHMPGKIEDQRAPKIYNLKQTGVKPPTFKLTVNFPASFAEAWKKIFEKEFRLKFGFEGSPIIINYARRS